MSSEKSEPALVEGITPALAEQKLYFNGFALSVTPADTIMTLQMDGRPILSLYFSHEIMRTMFDKLGDLNASLEPAGLSFRNLDDTLALIRKAGGT